MTGFARLSLAAMLTAIAARDPDGWPTEPTPHERTTFRAWAIHTYGLEVWDVYLHTAWAEVGND